jgi:CHAT domain-containing protein
MNRAHRRRFVALLAGLAVSACAAEALADDSGDFALGNNAEAQTCRAVARFDAPKGTQAADIYCGAWERPSGRVTLYASESAAAAALQAICTGDATALQSPEFTELRQIACARTGQSGPRRYAMVARHGQQVVIGDVFPSDWAPLINAARVLAGAAPKSKAASASGAGTPGLAEIQAVFPSGPPGQGAAANYELLRRRAYEYNLMWSFGASQRDFQELLRAHAAIAPDDADGEAELLAEIGLNMSSARRFDEAAETLNEAMLKAKAANDGLLLTKITNYQAIDQLNQRRYSEALRLALAANQARANLARANEAGGGRITSGDVGRVENRPSTFSQRSLLVSLTDFTSADKAAILSAQADYVAGVACKGLGRAGEAVSHLDAASALLAQAKGPPAWLVADIAGERAELKAAAGDYAGAVAAAQRGLALIKTIAPGTRSEAHLWLSLEAGQAGLGQTEAALTSGRAAINIFANQSESPGLPPDIAAGHLRLLESEWRRTGDAKLATEYFQTIALVWDGAAARTTAQLAARLVLRQAGGEARLYQDAERAYRAAYARRQILAGDPDTPPAQLAQTDAQVKAAATALASAEAALRDRAPAYLELLSPQVTAADVQAVLADHEAYLRLSMASDGGFGALVDKDGVHPFLISLTGAQVDALVDKLRRTTHLHGRILPDYDLQAASALYEGLVAPIQDRLAGVQSLDLDVSGSLASAPFAALVATPPDAALMEKVRSDQDYSGVDWLARHVGVANTLGPAAFVRLRRQPPAASTDLRAAVFGDYQPDPAEAAARIAKQEGLSEACRRQVQKALAAMGALPETADEARKVASSFGKSRLQLGPDFTDADFMQSPDVADADVIVLATHGVLALSSCFVEPALLTSVGEKGDGLIEASELLDRQLKARLVVLSACDTAGGGKIDEARTGLDDGGDALSGLARAFIYAGARDVLATEWSVDATTSAQEMTDLLAGANQGKQSLVKALSDAQRKLYESAETGHPFYWAAFILVGDGGGALNGPLRTAALP